MSTPNSVIQTMQKILNTAACLIILRPPHHQNCTPLLQQLHWLPISEQIKYKLLACVTTQSQVLPLLMFLNHCTFPLSPLFVRHTHAQTSTTKPMAFALVITSDPASGTIFPRTSGFSTLFSYKSKLKTFLFSLSLICQPDIRGHKAPHHHFSYPNTFY